MQTRIFNGNGLNDAIRIHFPPIVYKYLIYVMVYLFVLEGRALDVNFAQSQKLVAVLRRSCGVKKETI